MNKEENEDFSEEEDQTEYERVINEQFEEGC